MISVRFASRLWDFKQRDIRDWVDDISKKFTGAGWKNLPQELVDEILGYLLDDPGALKASSLTCKRLFGATRPLIHRRLVCLGSRPVLPKPKESLFSRRERDPGLFERLVYADRSGVLRYAQHLIIKLEEDYIDTVGMQEHLPHLRSIPKLHTLTLDTFPLRLLIPVLNTKRSTIFTDNIRHLSIQNTYGTGLHLSYIVCQFPLLEDLTIMPPAETLPEHLFHAPTIAHSPPLRGTLVLARTRSRELYEGLAAYQHGLNFRSLELFRCGDPRAVFASCGRTVTSVSCVWQWGDADTLALNLSRCVVLERFEFNLNSSSLWQIPKLFRRALRTITSTAFNEIAVWIINTVHPWSIRWLLNDDGWGVVDALLDDLAERNPGFRVVFRGDLHSFRYNIDGQHHSIRWLIESGLPIVSSKGLVKFEQVTNAENRFRKLGIL